MSGIRYPEEFKIEALKQVTDRGYKIGEVAKRLGVTPKSMHDWMKKYGDTGSQHQTITGQQDELRQLKAQRRRVTEERYILKEAAVYFASESKKYTFIKARLKQYPVATMSRVLEIHPSGAMSGTEVSRAGI